MGEAARHAPGPVTLTVSPLLAEAVAVSLRAAQLTDGDVDPTVGGALAASATTGTSPSWPSLGQADARVSIPPTAASKVSVRVIPGWQSVSVDVAARTLTVPPGVQLDLGATVKGWAADRSAALIADRLGCGVLVSLGGDTAVAGPPPDGGWRIRVQDTTGLPEETHARPEPGGGDPRRRSRHLLDGRAPLASRRRPGAPHPRPAHRPVGRPGLAHRLGGRRDLRRREHRGHRRDHPRRPGSRLASQVSSFPPTW